MWSSHIMHGTRLRHTFEPWLHDSHSFCSSLWPSCRERTVEGCPIFVWTHQPRRQLHRVVNHSSMNVSTKSIPTHLSAFWYTLCFRRFTCCGCIFFFLFSLFSAGHARKVLRLLCVFYICLYLCLHIPTYHVHNNYAMLPYFSWLWQFGLLLCVATIAQLRVWDGYWKAEAT